MAREATREPAVVVAGVVVVAVGAGLQGLTRKAQGRDRTRRNNQDNIFIFQNIDRKSVV